MRINASRYPHHSSRKARAERAAGAVHEAAESDELSIIKYSARADQSVTVVRKTIMRKRRNQADHGEYLNRWSDRWYQQVARNAWNNGMKVGRNRPRCRSAMHQYATQTAPHSANHASFCVVQRQPDDGALPHPRQACRSGGYHIAKRKPISPYGIQVVINSAHLTGGKSHLDRSSTS